jgi:uncharacterized membrane protein
MKRVLPTLRSRPRLLTATALGIAAFLLLPGAHGVVTRGLLGWNVAVWIYLMLVAAMMLRADETHLRRSSVAQSEGAFTVLAIVALASMASLVGIVFELSAAKAPGVPHAWPHVAFALVTVAGSWLLMPTMFALTYASLYYRVDHGSGLQFPHDDTEVHPDYDDFLYFAFTIAVASQTADVSVSGRAMRRLVLLQSVLSFAFNTAILAFTVNIAASKF